MSLTIRADRQQPALVDGEALPWSPSPEPGVERRMLERSGDEIAIATSIVRYGAGVRFPSHVHELGEEFFVLEGVFSDHQGDYPRGTYVRNPPGSAHSPHSNTGCVILVKLRQMQEDEHDAVRVFPGDRRWQRRGEGSECAPLYRNDRIDVSLLRLEAGATWPEREAPRGEELFVIEGALELLGSAIEMTRWTWRRDASYLQPGLRSARGALLWMKRGHL